ncbi:putative WRKY transcription factor 4 [Tasmannia lanceolata]|uniref:putative WRKY transcription factor 4 n=1 Tax=Tasmannia lanceolata TaxID=3420 RepID=UPI004062F8A2
MAEEQSTEVVKVDKEEKRKRKGKEKEEKPLEKQPNALPSISMPDHSVEALFKGTCAQNSVTETLTLSSSSPGPNERDSDPRSFCQLLAGAMASPAANFPPVLAAGFEMNTKLILGVDPTRLALAAHPGFIRVQGQFGMSHQEALASVTALAAQAQAHMQCQARYLSSTDSPPSNSLTRSMLVPLNPTPLQQRPPQVSEENISMLAMEQHTSSDQKAHPCHTIGKKPSGDGYNWRKYGQKHVKSSGEGYRSYYKCTHANCHVKKKVLNCGSQVTEITYKGQHSHDPPQKIRSSKGSGFLSDRTIGGNETVDLPGENPDGSNLPKSMSKQSVGHATPEQPVHYSNDCDGNAGITADEESDDEPDPKRTRTVETTVTYSAPLLKTVKEPRVVLQTASDPESLSDGYRWRKYGQKLVKGNPNPRSYYKCTSEGCPVRKHVEKALDNVNSLVVKYEGKHNHGQPECKKSDDPPTTALLIAAATTAGKQLKASNISPDPQPSKRENAGEDGDDITMESAQTLLSIGLNSKSSETDGGSKNPNIIQQSLFNKNHAAVSA